MTLCKLKLQSCSYHCCTALWTTDAELSYQGFCVCTLSARLFHAALQHSSTGGLVHLLQLVSWYHVLRGQKNMIKAPVIAMLAPTASPISGRCLSTAQPHSTASATKYPPYTAYTYRENYSKQIVRLLNADRYNARYSGLYDLLLQTVMCRHHQSQVGNTVQCHSQWEICNLVQPTTMVCNTV
jgi:hypothetical protein